MMRTEKRKSATACLAVAVLLTCCLVQMTDCYRLKKTERRKDADAATGIGVQEGTIVFGKAFQRGSGLESHVIDGTRKASSNDSVEDEAAYQADYPGYLPGQMKGVTSKEAAWKTLHPYVHCMRDHMKFRAVGQSASHLLLDQLNGPAIPLSQVPSSCGYSMHRNSMALVMLVPYNGCNVVQEGGSYVLPMRWHGVPVSIWCSKPAPTTAAPQYTVPQTTVPPPANPDVPQIPKFPPFYFFAPPHPYPKLPPVVSDPAMPVKNPDMPKFPSFPPFLPPYFPYLPPPPQTTTPAPTTTTTKPSTTSVQQMPFDPPYIFPLPLYPNVHPHFPWPLPGSLPPVSYPTVTIKPASKPQLPQFPHYFPIPQFPPFFHPHIQQHQFPQDPLDMTTAAPSTTEAPVNPIVTLPQSHYHPHYHLPSHPLQHPQGHPFQFMQFPIPKI